MHIVGEKAFRVEDGSEALRTSVHGHGLAVLVLVHFHDGVEAFFQSATVRGKTYDGQDKMGTFSTFISFANFEQLGRVASIDIVAGDGASVAC